MDNKKRFSEVNQYIVITLGEEHFGIGIKYIDNIVKMQHITRVPNTVDCIRGVINLRGEIVPVMSLRLRMGLEADVETKNSRIIIVRLEQFGMLGLIVDEVREVLNLEEGDLEKVGPSGDGQEENREVFIFAVGKYGKSLVSLLDLNAVALDKE